MKKLIIAASLAIGLLTTFESQAQYVELNDGKVYVDVRDLPAGSWSNTTLNSVHDENSSTNTLFKRLEVAKTDGALYLTWDAAKTSCAQRGAGWRLPTIKELFLMYLLKDMLLRAKADPFVANWYWSSTSASLYSATRSLACIMSEGIATHIAKTETGCLVRCVREVTN